VGEVASFDDFYRAVNKRSPLPWQSRLANLVVSQGWPQQIGVPTGMGKTSCLDIAIWALAQSAHAGTRHMPTRIWYVVNRRLLVDAAWEHAKRLKDLLAHARPDERGQQALASVREGLTSLSGLGTSDGPLFVTRLRGGAELGARPPDPSQPSLLLATVPMFASRWLFRGYGSSTSMRPVDAAHAGIDCLVLLDEAHLARPLLRLKDAVASCDIGDPRAVLPATRSRPVVVAMTATGEEESEQFTLDDTDLANQIVSQRLRATKRGQLIETTRDALAKDLASQASAAIGGRKEACIVFTNTPVVAREVAQLLKSDSQREGAGPDVMLVTGRTREREADRLRARLLDPVLGVSAGHERHFERSLVVVATQTLEVGADVDFDHLVTETAGARSLVQRLGRVNRLGHRPQATATICHPSDMKTWPVYEAEPAKVWARLQREKGAGKDVDLSPANATKALGTPEDTPGRVGELLPAHLWEWAKTTTPPQGEAPVELFFEGFDTNVAEVSLVWRAHRPLGVRLLPSITEAEAVDIPISEVRAVLNNRLVSRLADDKASLEETTADHLRPGDVVVLAPEDGLYDPHGWAPNSKETVLDVSPLTSGTLLLDARVLENLAPGSSELVAPLLRALTVPPDDVALHAEEQDEASLLDELVRLLRDFAPHPWLSRAEWAEFLDGLSRKLTWPIGPGVDKVPRVEPAKRQRGQHGTDVRSDAFEELSLTASSQLLSDHLGAVGETAALIATRLGVPDDLVKALRLAGEWHDLGKHDPRFQRWLSPDGPTVEPLAKSFQPRALWESSRALSGWPKGGRHELLSARLAFSWLQGHPTDCDPDLVLHLVASHHGEGRPFVKVVADAAPSRTVAPVFGQPISVSGDLALPDWQQPRRFRNVCERYGLWGVALLEAILRQADHAVSQLTQVA